MMGLTGILCASDTELEPFLKRMKIEDTIEKAMLKFYRGTIEKAKVVAVYSGVCKVNAAIVAQLLIDQFHVERIINAGTAGGMSREAGLFDTIVGKYTCYHDVDPDILTDFHPWMESAEFPADQELLERMKEQSALLAYPIRFGKIVTGEQFIEEENRSEINRKFAPLAVDMESASIAHVCYVNQIPFLSVRTITDTEEHVGVQNFEQNCEKASEICAEVVTGLIAKIGFRGLESSSIEITGNL